MIIPSFFVVKGFGNTCLRPDNTQKSPSGLLKLGEPDPGIFSPRVKFVAEQSKTGDPSLVHIRSCFNNKYWVAQEEDGQPGSFVLAASAKKPQEDTTDLGCTLFRVTYNNPNDPALGKRFFSMINSQSLQVVCDDAGFIRLQGTHYFHPTVVNSSFSVDDWEELVMLPSQVTFRSEQLDGNYLCSRVLKGGNYHRFESGLDIADPRVAYELIPTCNGDYYIKSLYFGKNWRGIPEWVVADADQEDTTIHTLFAFTKLSGDNTFALSYYSNKKFCAGDHVHRCLSAYLPGILEDTRLIVEERIMQKNISNVRYRLSDSIIHDEEVVEVFNEFLTNANPDKDDIGTLNLSQSESFTTSWTNSDSLTSIGASYGFGFEVGEAPYVADNQIEISTGFDFEREWGKSNTKGKESIVAYKVTLPPLTTMKISVMVVNGVCEVPFDYTETVLLPNGEWVTREKEDGIYKGIRSLEFRYDSKPVDYDTSLGKVIGH